MYGVAYLPEFFLRSCEYDDIITISIVVLAAKFVFDVVVKMH